ncbi:parvo_NS1 domain-containing protein [Caerostris extrusa]|uniref:Parvo_NS1 domain-containing protein n=1 Tax=Caerostris extrusa TaxID=172846 RepID=A0AAV4QIB9_CAEEX|nr:parvo_NS1 domain-containing protein [Caerostris extrusa]
MTKACIFYGDVSQAVAGYGFMWQYSVNKRMVLINKPFFDNCCIEELKTVLEGTGTFVKECNTRRWLCILLLRYTNPAPPTSLFFDSSDGECTPSTTGTDVLQDKRRGPTNEPDRYCRQHDILISQLDAEKKAAKRFLHRAPKQGWLSNFFAGLIAAINNLRGLPRSEYLPGEGDTPTSLKRLLTHSSV